MFSIYLVIQIYVILNQYHLVVQQSEQVTKEGQLLKPRKKGP